MPVFAQQVPNRRSLASAVAMLREKSAVPLRLPAIFPSPDYLSAKDRKRPLNSVVTDARPDGFTLEYCFSDLCRGEYYYGVISGERITPKTEPPAGKAVELADGITGYFEEGSCGASCGHGWIFWDQDGFRYGVGLNVNDDLETLVKFANSAIGNDSLIK